MCPTPNKSEKRKFLRYTIRTEIFAALGRTFSRVGRVTDVSAGGLAFEYIPFEQKENDHSRIDVFATGNGLHLSKIPCRIIYEVSKEDEVAHSFLPAELRTKRCGVAFDNLTEFQVAQVKQLIDNYRVTRKTEKPTVR